MAQNADDLVTVGVDVGGTKINVGLVDSDGSVLSSHKSLISDPKEPDAVIDEVAAGVTAVLDDGGMEAKAFGIGIAAQVNEAGVVLGSPNLGWQNFPLKKKLEKKLGLPVLID